MSDSRIIVALDYANASDAMQMADQIDPKRARVKVGKELFTRSGPQVVTDLVSRAHAAARPPSRWRDW